MENSGVVYLHGHHRSVLCSHQWRTVENSAAYLTGSLRRGMDVLDVGCGPGTVTVDLAGRVAPGRVIGVDSAPDVLDLARAHATEHGADNVSFEQADVYRLPYADATFDVVHAHQVLQHLGDPVAALVEMRRVCSSSGVVAARDGVYAAMTYYPPDPALDRWLALYRLVARRDGGEPDAGSHLLAWARAAGFERVHTSASAWCFATPEERSWWGGMWAERVVASAFADHAVGHGLTDRRELEDLSAAWRRWADADDAWFAVVHGEILCRR